jgi:hypothetical protein
VKPIERSALVRSGSHAEPERWLSGTVLMRQYLHPALTWFTT